MYIDMFTALFVVVFINQVIAFFISESQENGSSDYQKDETDSRIYSDDISERLGSFAQSEHQ